MSLLRPLLPDEADQLTGWIQKYFAHDGLKFTEKVGAAAAQLLSRPELGRAWIIQRDSSAIGYLVVTFGFDHEAGGRIGVVTDFYLEEPFRGQGVGSRVIEHLKEWGEQEGLSQLELFVLNHNEGAKKLYSRHGFLPPSDREFRSIRLSHGVQE